MPRGKYSVTGFWALLLLAGSCAISASHAHAQPNKADLDKYVCVTCHQALDDEKLTPPVDQWKESAHFEAGILCADCHGGNPTNEETSMEPSEGFVGKPKRENVSVFCAKCHSDAKMMRAFNQRADQLDLYTGSVHGRKMANGDLEAATCVDCHGKHKILRVKDPNSPVNRKNIPQTCGGCHSSREIFAKRNKPFNELELYKKSWHYEKFTLGDVLTPTCKDCHGNHDIMPAKSERTQTVCFNCHAAQAENYKASPHWAAFKKGGEPVCLHCHKNHDVTRPTLAKFDGKGEADCSACHEEGSAAYKTGLEMQSMVRASMNAVETAAIDLKDFKSHSHGGFEISQIEERLEKAQARLADVLVLTHRMEKDPLKKESEAVISQALSVSGDVQGMLAEIKTRKMGLAGAWIVFIGFMYTVWAKAKTWERRD